MQVEISRSLQDRTGKCGALAPASSEGRPRPVDKQMMRPIRRLECFRHGGAEVKEVTDLVRENMATARSAENIATGAQQTASAVSGVVDAGVEEGAESISMEAAAAGDKKSRCQKRHQVAGKRSKGGRGLVDVTRSSYRRQTSVIKDRT
jgi:hypothetical protein